jgi:membrane glycosyltransferase
MEMQDEFWRLPSVWSTPDWIAFVCDVFVVVGAFFCFCFGAFCIHCRWRFPGGDKDGTEKDLVFGMSGSSTGVASTETGDVASQSGGDKPTVVVGKGSEGGAGQTRLKSLSDYPTATGLNNKPATTFWHRLFRRTTFFVPVVVTTLGIAWLLWVVIRINGVSVLELTLLWSTIVLAYHNSVSFWSATFGFAIKYLLPPIPQKHVGPSPVSCTGYVCPLLALPRSSQLGIRTALVMPICNEDVMRVLAGIDAITKSLIKECKTRSIPLELFEIFVMSDTNDEELVEIEKKELSEYCFALEKRGLACTYCLRLSRKAGNLANFLERFSHSFEAMVVLDAYSIMSGQAVVTLAQLIQDNPSVGLIQQQPMPVRQKTSFGRMFQFSANAFCETLAHGYAYWWLDSACFAGHNAIIRIEPFQKYCTFPNLPLPGPMGGHAIGHDHAEAALLRAAGWGVWYIPLGFGSYEEIPTNLIDYMKRESRWLVRFPRA